MFRIKLLPRDSIAKNPGLLRLASAESIAAHATTRPGMLVTT